ncbi:hypothetical protein MMC29_002001 [Sticta canariensis]|nr:hypothetical protein [Sticta canariensis]
MEAVGLILGAIPLVISALQSYKDAKKFGSRFLNRKKHVEKLIRALQEQHGVLQINIVWLFKAIDEPYHDVGVGNRFKDAAIQSKMIDFLGTEGFESYDSALKRAEQAIKRIARSIKEFLPESQPTEDTLQAVILAHSAEDERFKFQRSWKLSMGENDVEQKITELRDSTSILSGLQYIGVNIRQMEASAPLKKSKSRKVTDSLIRIQKYASHLYRAIADGWTPGCHSTHEARLMLEDRVETVAAASNYPKPSYKRQIDFNIIFASDNIPICDILWHEGRVTVIEGDLDADSKTSQPITSSAPLQITSRPRVTFSIVPKPKGAHPSAEEVNDLCLTICPAKQEKKKLEFYLSLHKRLQYCQPSQPADAAAPTPFTRTVSLRAILTKSASTSDRSKKLPLKPRLFLALTLASTLIQLVATPWLTSRWSNESIHFSSPSQTVEPSQIDLKRPLLTREFQNPPNAIGMPQHQPEPREMILELGIMLLELGNETTLEDHFSGTNHIINHEYHARLSLAVRWLDESEPHLTPTYFDVTARCIRCHFDGIPYPAVWNEDLFMALAQYVIDPLQEQCRPTQRIQGVL